RAKATAAFDDDVLGKKRGQCTTRLLHNIPGAAVLLFQGRIAIDVAAKGLLCSLLAAKDARVAQPCKLAAIRLGTVLELEDLVLHLAPLVTPLSGVPQHRAVAAVQPGHGKRYADVA